MLTRLLTTTALVMALAVPVAAQQQEPQAQPDPAQQQPADQTQVQPADAIEQQPTDQAQTEPADATEQQPADQAQTEPTDATEPEAAQAEAEQPAGQQAASFDYIKAQEEGQLRTDELIGRDVTNAQDEAIGEISDLLLDQEQKVTGVIVGVGGFLGIGQKQVALPIEAVQIDEEMVRVDATSEQLSEAPEFATLEDVQAAEEAAQAQQQMQQQGTAAPAAGGAPAPAQ